MGPPPCRALCPQETECDPSPVQMPCPHGSWELRVAEYWSHWFATQSALYCFSSLESYFRNLVQNSFVTSDAPHASRFQILERHPSICSGVLSKPLSAHWPWEAGGPWRVSPLLPVCPSVHLSASLSIHGGLDGLSPPASWLCKHRQVR